MVAVETYILANDVFSFPSQILPFSPKFQLSKNHFNTMSLNFNSHAFAGNPIKSKTPKPTDPFSPTIALQTLKSLLSGQHVNETPTFKILPYRKGGPLTCSVNDSEIPNWQLGWLSFSDCKAILGNYLSEDSFLYLGSDIEDDGEGVYVVYWGIDVTEADSGLVNEFGKRQFCFVELRTLMVATDWDNSRAMGQLAIAGHARSLLEWHRVSRFCGVCGGKTIPTDAGRRKQCSNELCKKKIYPRVDPVVIMLVIDRENDRVLLGRQSRFMPRMWSCLAGFIEPGESLEEAVRRETREESGIEAGQVVYHSSQPWPVGPSSMPCQIMVGFLAYAKSLDINVDKEELEDVKWHSREDVKNAVTLAEYKKAQRIAAAKVDQMCNGVEKGQDLSVFNVESGELAPMFIPGPTALAHHLISSWVNGAEAQVRQLGSSFSNL